MSWIPRWRHLTQQQTRIAVAIIALSGSLLLLIGSSAQPADTLKGLADLVRALAWPAVVVAALLTLRNPISAQIERISKFSVAGATVELNNAITKEFAASAAEAQSRPGGGLELTPNDVRRAQNIQRLATANDEPAVRGHLFDLASDYQRIREEMKPGFDRTRAMSAIVLQMRVLGQVGHFLRGELAFSRAEGQRLAALAIAQIKPDIAMAGWIASCVGPNESRFIQFQALQALIVAVRNADTSELSVLLHAYDICRTGYDHSPPDKKFDRPEIIEALGAEIERRQQPAGAG